MRLHLKIVPHQLGNNLNTLIHPSSLIKHHTEHKCKSQKSTEMSKQVVNSDYLFTFPLYTLLPCMLCYFIWISVFSASINTKRFFFFLEKSAKHQTQNFSIELELIHLKRKNIFWNYQFGLLWFIDSLFSLFFYLHVHRYKQMYTISAANC